MRALELFLANLAKSSSPPALAWTTASVAVAADETVDPVVIIMVGLKGRAWLALGALHVWAWLRVRATMGSTQQGYRVRVHVPLELLASCAAAGRVVGRACLAAARACRSWFGQTLARVGWWP